MTLDKSWATPVNPLAYTSAGIKNKFSPAALSKAPMMTMSNFLFDLVPLHVPPLFLLIMFSLKTNI